MIAWCHDFVAVFDVMQDHGAVPHDAMQCNHRAVPHGAMQKGSDCKFFAYLAYFTLKFPKKVNCSHFHPTHSLILYYLNPSAIVPLDPASSHHKKKIPIVFYIHNRIKKLDYFR
jgi:hypothetical protein